jgi:hypothetical protein
VEITPDAPLAEDDHGGKAKQVSAQIKSLIGVTCILVKQSRNGNYCELCLDRHVRCRRQISRRSAALAGQSGAGAGRAEEVALAAKR